MRIKEGRKAAEYDGEVTRIWTDGTPDAATVLRRDVSVTAACLGWSRTLPLLDLLARAVNRRRGTHV